MNTSIAFPAQKDFPVLPPAIAALIARWDASRPAADLIAAINERCEQQSAVAIPINTAKTVKKRGKCMSRRPGQDGSKEYDEGGWFKFRIWVDVADKREHPSIKICPVKGPGFMNASERHARKLELITEYTGKNKESVESLGGITFGEQSKIMLAKMRTRKRKPVAQGTLGNYERAFRLHLSILMDMPLANIYSAELNLVVNSLVEKGMKASTMASQIIIAKSVVSSAINRKTSEALYPRAWNAEVIDLPIADPDEMNTPSFSREVLTGIIAYFSELRMRVLFIVLAATGMRISEMLGVRIDKHLSSDFLTISIEQQANGHKVVERVKRRASRRQIDFHPDIAAVIKAYVGDRKSGFLFETSPGYALCASFVLLKLHRALKDIGYVNEQTGTSLAGEHAFRRSRDTYLRNETQCTDSVCKFWLGHSFGKNMNERYDKVKRDRKLRLEMAKSCGYGFDLPPVVLAVPELDTSEEVG